MMSANCQHSILLHTPTEQIDDVPRSRAGRRPDLIHEIRQCPGGLGGGLGAVHGLVLVEGEQAVVVVLLVVHNPG